MNLVSIKSLSEVQLDGVNLDWTKEDKSIKELRIRDKNGGRLIVRAGSYGDTLRVMVPQPYEEDDRWCLSGKFLGLFDVSEYFESEYDAKDKLRDYSAKAPHGEEHGLSIQKVRVKINDAGKVMDQTAASPVADDVIF